MHGLFQDTMAIVNRFGKPTLFLTFTANPMWKENTRELHRGEHPSDRPDIVVRAFCPKRDILLGEIKFGKAFGCPAAHVWTIEYQKRGLPHMHLVIWILDEPRRCLMPKFIDTIISAELPTPDEDPDGVLREIIPEMMLHGPCGKFNPSAPCMEKNKGPEHCSKAFPRPLQDRTVV